MLFKSLKGRFIGFTVALSVVTLVGTFIAQQKIETTTSEIAENLSERHQMHIITRQINVHVFDGYKALNAFLLDPTRTEYKLKVHESLVNASELTKGLESHPWIVKFEQSQAIDTLHHQLNAFDLAATELIEIRSNGLKLYPALAIANDELRPNRDLFNAAVFVTLFELNELVADKQAHEIYDSFAQARQQWMQIVSAFRLYLANKVGAFDEKVISRQEESIASLFEILYFMLSRIDQYNEQGKLNFVAQTALADMHEASKKWFKGYNKIRELHLHGYWRIDAQIIKFNIEPLLFNISEQLQSLNGTVRAAGVSDVRFFSKVASKQTQIIWIVGLCAIFIVVLILLITESLVLRPIATIVSAMKLDSFGKIARPINHVGTKETQDLIDTFTKMQSEVLSRQQELEHKALHDELTSLPNRTLLNDRIEQAIYYANRSGNRFALLILDLDRFKEINDTLGHHIGDLLLIEMSNRIKEELRQSDTIARLGGDEFAIVLSGCDKDEVYATINRISNAISAPVTIQDMQLHIESSIGMATYPEHGIDTFSLLSHADVAMYFAKRNNLSFSEYNASEDKYTLRRLSLFGSLKEAIEKNEITLHYQPLISVNDKTIISVEALVRWDHSELGRIPSEELVTIAEQSGLITPLTEWVLNEGIEQCAQWYKQGFNISVAINLSVLNLHDSSLTERISRLLAKHKIAPRLLTLEITETAMMTNPKNAMKTLNKLNDMGLTLAIDDFGTGFSSLSYLKQLPVKKLKIDKSFVLNLLENESDGVIVKSTIELAHNLGIEVIAEGIESEAVFNQLAEWNCDIAQGFFISKPQSAEVVRDWIIEYTNREMAPVSIFSHKG
ncbi:MAG: EAL domain-containing protein [Gammaproteobacteria bacterium]|nr:EAL domain-containing protein [Gammaproteobacteria bacterium]